MQGPLSYGNLPEGNYWLKAVRDGARAFNGRPVTSEEARTTEGWRLLSEQAV